MSKRIVVLIVLEIIGLAAILGAVCLRVFAPQKSPVPLICSGSLLILVSTVLLLGATKQRKKKGC